MFSECIPAPFLYLVAPMLFPTQARRSKSSTSLRSVLRDLGIESKSTSEDLPQVVLGKLICIHRKTIHKYKGMVEAGVKPVYTEEHVAIGTVESDQCEPELPECLTEPTDVCLTEPTDVSREEELLKIEKYLEEEIFPQKGKLTLWQAHPNYGPGMRLAELATQWLVNGHSWNQWSDHLAWLRNHFPSSFGDLQHSKQFLRLFLPTLVATAHTCVASSLHSVLPAIGLPSFVARIIDVVSIDGRSLLPTIYVYTNSQGNLAWALLGMPCLEYRHEETAIGVPPATQPEWFGFHKAPQIVRSVHQVEAAHHIGKADRQLRVVLTVADQAIQGPGSVQFSREECKVEGRIEDPIAIGICRFHIADGVGAAVDKQFAETSLFDQLLRLIRRHFAFGTGHLILTSVATRFARMASEIESEAADIQARALTLQSEGKPLAAARLLTNAAKRAAEAKALHRAGWTKWHRPTAPRADGSRKVVYQSKARANLFQIHGLIYWGLKIRMQQSLESSRQARIKAGETPTAQTGLNTKAMKAWRSLGQATTNIEMLVFNMGRADFRQKHLQAYALEVQVSLKLSPLERAVDIAESMMAAIGALVAAQGIIRLLESLCRGLSYEIIPSTCGQKPRGRITNSVFLKDRREAMPRATTLWLLSKTLLAHRAWRSFPLMSMRLTEIVLAGYLRGVPLHGFEFEQKLEPLIPGNYLQAQWDRVAGLRKQRFDSTSRALQRLIKWAKAERHCFMERLLGVAPVRAAPNVGQAVGLPRVEEISQDLDDLRDESDCDEVPVQHCYFAPRQTPAIGGGALRDRVAVADLVETNYALKDKEIYEAAVALAESFASLGQVIGKDDDTTDLVDEIYEHVHEQIRVYPEAAGKTVQDRSSSSDESLCAREVQRQTNPMQASVSAAIGAEKSSSSSAAMGLPNSSAAGIGAQKWSSSPAAIGATKSSPSSAAIGAETASSSSTVIGARSEFIEHFLREPSRDWIIFKSKTTHKWKIVTTSRFFKAWRNHLTRNMHARNLFLLEVGVVFSPCIVEDDGMNKTKSVQNGLRLLHQQCQDRFWNVKNVDQYAKVIAVVPNEMSHPCTFEDLENQHGFLRQWLRSLKSEPFGHEFFEVHSCVVQRVDDHNRPIGKPLEVKQVEIVGASHWHHRWTPKENTIIQCNKYGRCMFLSTRRSPDMMKMYSYVMTTSISEIRARNVWNIVVGWHYFVHASISTESLAETVGSFLTALANSKINQSVRRIAWGAQLKAVGVKGTGSEDGFLAMAMNEHFGCKGPEGWHIRARGTSVDKGSHWRQADRQREKRVNEMPEWVRENILDLVRAGRMRLCKTLPMPAECMLSKADARHCQQDTVTAKRKHIDKEGEKQLQPSALAESLWRHLNLSRNALPSHARPGKRPR